LGPRIQAAAFGPGGRTLLTGNQSGIVRLWDAATGEPRSSPLQHDQLCALAISPDGKVLLTAGWDKTVRLWDAATGEQLGQPLRHQKGVYAMAVSPDGKTILTGSEDRISQLWEAIRGKPLGPPLPHHSLVRAAAFSPDGKLVLTGCDDGTARLWDAATGQPIGLPLAHQSYVKAVAFSPDGKIILTGSNDQTARLWDVATCQPLGQPLPHQGTVSAVAFSPDGRIAATGSADQTARLWDVSMGQPFGLPLPHRAAVMAVAFASDGKGVWTYSEDNRVRMWQAPAPVEGPPEQVILVARVSTGMELDDAGGIRVLDAAAWRHHRQRLEEFGARPLPPGPALAWHQRSAQGCEADGQWFAARWHLDRLLAADPSDRTLRARRDWAGAALRDRAVADYLSSMLRTAGQSFWEQLTLTGEQRAEWDRAAIDHTAKLRLEPGQDRYWQERGLFYARLGQWKEAASNYARAVEMGPEKPAYWFEYACVLLLAGDREGYRKACAGALRRFGQTKDSGAAYLVARMCLLAPDPDTDLNVPDRLAAQAVAAAPRWHGYTLHTLGLSSYRFGNYELAIRRLRRSLEDDPDWNAHVVDWLVLAMAHYCLGQEDEARQWLAKAVLAIDKAAENRPKEIVGEFPPHPHDWLSCLLLRREAETLLKRTKP
jgi:tetratricopeptide (TPR) repeat protein